MSLRPLIGSSLPSGSHGSALLNDPPTKGTPGGDGTIEEWDDLRREVAEESGLRVTRYLLGEPLLGDYLADGLAAFGLSWVDADDDEEPAADDAGSTPATSPVNARSRR